MKDAIILLAIFCISDIVMTHISFNIAKKKKIDIYEVNPIGRFIIKHFNDKIRIPLFLLWNTILFLILITFFDIWAIGFISGYLFHINLNHIRNLKELHKMEASE